MRRLTITSALVALALAVSACGGSGPGDSAAPDTTASTQPADTTSEAPDNSEPAGATSLADLFLVIATLPTEAGPRPLLAWDSVAGADEYYVVVLDSAGEPYWAWSGVESSINVGGVDDPEGLGAWVGEPMSWTVSAVDADGNVLGLSESADLEP